MATKKIIVLIHGIRDYAEWQNVIRPVLEETEGIECRPCQYGRFDLLRFLLPGPWRNRPANKVVRFLANVRGPTVHRPSVDNAVPISVIAHSFGTHTLFKALQHNDCPPLHDIILCGSVLSRDADFQSLKDAGMITGNIINDHSYCDVWPTVAQSVTWGYSASGTTGFEDAGVENRAHTIEHSDFLKPHFARKYWKPLFENPPRVEPSPLAVRSGARVPKWFMLFSFPWRWVLAALLLVLVTNLALIATSSDSQKARRYFFASNDSGIVWKDSPSKQDGFVHPQDEGASTAESKRAGNKPDVWVQICPGARERDKNAALNLLSRLRASGKWGHLYYKRYERKKGEPVIKFNGLISVNILAPESDLNPTDRSQLATGDGYDLRRLENFIAGLNFIPSSNNTRHPSGNKHAYFVVLCSRRFLGL